MRIFIIILSLLLSAPNLFSQDTAWAKKKIDENLTISFPGSVSQIDTSFIKEGKSMRFKAFKSETTNCVLTLIITPNETDINADNSESLQKALAAMAKGSINAMTEKGFRCTISDTVIDEMACKKIMCHYGDFSIIVNYLFLINDKMYALQTAIPNGSESTKGVSEVNQYVNSLHFNKTSIKEQQFGSKAESIGYKIGYYLLPALLIIGLIIYFVRK